jgi:hypothetical protein
MKYQINDPTTPDLLVDITPTVPESHFPYTIRGCSAGDEVGTNSKISIDISLNSLSSILPILKWSNTQNLQVWPKAGKQFNAFYDRASLKFFYEIDKLREKPVFLANSSKITTHELGHATLDTYRPDLWNTQSAEIQAFHEGYGDINAIHTIMQSDLALEKALRETNGNLRNSNVLSRLAEEMGNAVYHARGHLDDNLEGLRNAVNHFTFIPPEKLPPITSDSELSRECHSFGRLILGTWYDIMVGIYELEQKDGLNQMNALKKAENVAFKMLVASIIQTPVTIKFHEALARIMLYLDKSNGSRYQELLSNVFKKREIISKEQVSNITGEKIVIENKQKMVKLADHIKEPEHLKAMFVQGYNLSDCEVEIAASKYYEFDKGNLTYEIAPTDDEIIEAAQACITAIDSIGPDPDTMWEVTDNKLMRTYICGRSFH